MTLSRSHDEIVQFNGRIASVSQVLADNTRNLDGALTNLDSALGDLKTFIDTNGRRLTESVARLADTTDILARKDEQIRGLLHSAPTQLGVQGMSSTHIPAAQFIPAPQVPQLPPQPSSPHSAPTQLGVHGPPPAHSIGNSGGPAPS